MSLKQRHIEILNLIIIVEKSTPKIPPILQIPWKLPTIFFSNFSWIEIDCVLMEILITLNDIENTTKEATINQIDGAKPTESKDNKKVKLATWSGIRLSNFETNQPESGIPIIALAGITISKFPKVFSSRLKLSFIVGILEAQVEKQIPERRKYAERAILCFCLFSNSFISCAKLRQSVLKIRIFFHQILIKI